MNVHYVKLTQNQYEWHLKYPELYIYPNENNNISEWQIVNISANLSLYSPKIASLLQHINPPCIIYCNNIDIYFITTFLHKYNIPIIIIRNHQDVENIKNIKNYIGIANSIKFLPYLPPNILHLIDIPNIIKFNHHIIHTYVNIGPNNEKTMDFLKNYNLSKLFSNNSITVS